MTIRRLLSPSLALFLTLGCTINVGARVHDLAVANAPGGTAVSLQIATSDAVLAGELLAARDSGLVVMSDGRITFARNESITSARIADAQSQIGARRRPTGEALSELRLLSRYPQDIPDELMARLLADTRQAAIVVVQD